MKKARHHHVLPFSVDFRRSIRQQRFPIWAPLAAIARAVMGSVGAAALALLLAAGLPFAAHAQTCANPAGGYEGFGRNTTGGAGKRVYRVKNLNDSGPDSLREALSVSNPFPEPPEGNRCIVFDVAGTIELLPSTRPSPCVPPAISGLVQVKGPNVTIDGFTAPRNPDDSPGPGITLKNWGFDLHGLPPPAGRGVGNVIVRGIRIRDTVHGPTPPIDNWECTGADGFQIVGVNNFVIDHVSIDGWADGSLDIAGENGTPSQNGTVQWSIFGKGNRPDGQDHSLLVNDSRRISIHHNLFINAHDRNPNIESQAGPLPEIGADIRNNLMWNYGPFAGTTIRTQAKANVVNNYYFTTKGEQTAAQALRSIDGGLFYANGNYSPVGLNIDGQGNHQDSSFLAEPVTTTDAVTAAHEIVAQAGARGPNFGLDTTDQNYINQVSLTPPPGVVLLALHENGSDGSTTFIDASSSNHTLTPAGLAQWDTAQAPTGLTSSGLFDGDADQIEAAGHPNFAFGTGDFTFEFFVRFNDPINRPAIMFDMRTGVPGEVAVSIYRSSDGKLAFSFESNDLIFSPPGHLVENTWYHIAVARAGCPTNCVTKMFSNGTQVGSNYVANDAYPQRHIIIGNRYDGPGLAVDGWMAGVRVTKGVARYTNNFTPPALPYIKD